MQELTALNQEFCRASSAVILLDGSKISILSSKHRAPDGRLQQTQNIKQSLVHETVTW